MQPGRLAVFSTVVRAGSPHGGATLTSGAGPVPSARRHILLELQWQGWDGRFRHVVVSSKGVRRALGASATVALLAVVALAAVSVGSSHGLASFEVDEVLAESRELTARQAELRERAFDLAEQLQRQIGQARVTLGATGSHGESWGGPCPDPPARDAADDTVMTWLETQGRRLAAFEDELRARRLEERRARASADPQGVGEASAVRHEG